MRNDASLRVTPRLILGLFLMSLGVLFTLGNLGLIETRRYLRLWPVLLIAVGVQKLAQPLRTPGRGVGGVWVVIGSWLLLGNLGLLRFGFRDLWPVALVMVGGSIVWRAVRGTRESDGTESHAFVNAMAIMGGTERKSNSQDFRGGDMIAIMGGCALDLTQASMVNGEVTIDTFAFMGGIEIKVPADWSVACKGLPLMGGFEDATTPPASDTGKRLVVTGVAIMGGVEVHN